MILMYHKISPDAPSMWWVEVHAFFGQLHSLRNRQVVYLDNYDPHNPNHVVITFDGVYRNVLTYAAPLLKYFGYPFELFVSGEHIGKTNEFDTIEPNAEFATNKELKRLVDQGGRLQWHTRSHQNLCESADRVSIEEELAIPQGILELDPLGFGWIAYPHGEFNDLVLDVARQRFRGGVSCNQGTDDDSYTLNRITVTNDSCFKKATTSVIIASYNYGRFLAEAIESVLRQTIPPDEILITDDCSSDDTWDIAESYREKYPNLIRTNKNNDNLGIVRHFNLAVGQTTGDYICILGADNRLRSDYLERTSEILDSDSGIGIAYTDFALFGPRAGVASAEMATQWNTSELAGVFHIVRFPDFDSSSHQALKTMNFIHGSSLFRREAYLRAGGYLSAVPLPEDHNLFLRIIESGWRARRSPHPLLEYRQHSREQANIAAVTESQLHYYRERHKQALQDIAALKEYINRTRTSFAWRFSTPVRVAENLIRKWIGKS